MTDKHYSIEEIEGIAKTYGDKLRSAGVGNTGHLLDKGRKKSGRSALAKETGISEKLILTWTNLADLMRISGIGPQFAELLEDAGVDTIKELRTRNPDNLADKMKSTNESRKVSGTVPGPTTVSKWIEAAKDMEPGVEY